MARCRNCQHNTIDIHLAQLRCSKGLGRFHPFAQVACHLYLRRTLNFDSHSTDAKAKISLDRP